MTFRSYTPDEYRKAGITAGPFALEGNPDPDKRNYRTARKIPIGFGVMHITAGLTDYTLPDASAEGTTNYGANITRDASWHVCVDSDSIIPSIRDEYVAWHAGVTGHPGINDASLGMEIGTSQVDWRKAPATWVERTLRRAAVWWAPRVIKHSIPLRLVTLAQCDAYIDAAFAGKNPAAIGFISHATIAPSNRRDPGMVGNPPTWIDTFPWAQFFQYVREETALLTPEPPKEWYLMPDIPQANLDQIVNALLDAPIEHPTLKDADGKPVTWPLRRAAWSDWYYSFFGYMATAKAAGVDVDEAALAQELAPVLAPLITPILGDIVKDAVAAAGPAATPEQVAAAVVQRLGEALAKPAA